MNRVTRRLAVIPARAGSKRLKGKNTKLFNDKPLIQHSIEAAQKSELFDSIVVTSDDPATLEIADACMVRGRQRPAELASDTATVNQTLIRLLDDLQADGELFDEMCCLYATAPLRSHHDVRKAQSMLASQATNFVIAVCRYLHTPYQALKRDDRKRLDLVWPEVGTIQSQKLPTPLVDNGSTYWTKIPAYREFKTFYGPGLAGFEMPIHRSIDIDTEEDFRLALALAQVPECHWQNEAISKIS